MGPHRVPPLLLLVLLAACREPAPAPAPGGGEPRGLAPIAPAAVPPSDGADAGRTDPDAGLDAAPADGEHVARRLASARVRGARTVSPRSLALKIAFEGGGHAVFKPRRRDDDSARHEVAFFRLARLLGVDGVPVSVVRRLPLPLLEGHLRRSNPAAADAFAEVVHRDGAGLVEGAVIEWMPDLGPSPFDGARGVARLRAMLALDGPAPVEEPLAAAASAMVVLDFLAGNWDRFSGGNLFTDAAGRLVLIDNNAAFDSWSEGQRRRMDGLLAEAERFPSALTKRVRRLDPATLDTIMSDARSGSRPLLNAKEIDRLFDRRTALLEHIDGLVAEHGADRILTFP